MRPRTAKPRPARGAVGKSWRGSGASSGRSSARSKSTGSGASATRSRPDDAAWIASRSPGAGRAAAPVSKPAEPELDDVIAAANAAWAARFGGGEA